MQKRKDSKARDVLFATIKEKFGHLDIVFANAGIVKMGSTMTIL